MKKRILALSLFFMASSIPLYASSPSLFIAPTGDGNTVTVNVTNADGNTPVVLFYTSALYTGTQSLTIGNTASNGTFSGNVSTSAYGITTVSQVYALINGYQTPYVTWPYNTTSQTSSSVITVSQINPTLIQGQTLAVTLSGGTGSYYISSNSNGSIIQASISGNILSLSGLQAGSGTITICSSNNACTSQVITVTSSSLNTNALYVTQNNLTLALGETTQVVVTGGTAPYSTFYDGTNKVTTTVNGSVVAITGVSLGNTSVTICGVTGGCTPVYISVVQTNTPSSTVVINVPLTIGQTLILPLSGGSGTYYIATPITSPFNATIASSKLYLVGTAIGNSIVTICSSATLCSSITVAVSAGTTAVIPTTTTEPSTRYLFTGPLISGMRSNEVLKLQERLVEEGYLNATPNGYYGQATILAVKAFQRAHNLSALGNVGPGTREALNK